MPRVFGTWRIGFTNSPSNSFRLDLLGHRVIQVSFYRPNLKSEDDAIMNVSLEMGI